jgi:hypothetical protein
MVAQSALDSIESLPTMEELDAVPLEGDWQFGLCKAPWSDSIPPDLLKRCKISSLQTLHELLCQYWEGVWYRRICEVPKSSLCTKTLAALRNCTALSIRSTPKWEGSYNSTEISLSLSTSTV